MGHLAYNDQIGDHVLAEIATGRALRSVLGDPGMPEATTWYRWMRLLPELKQRYDAAVMERAAAWAEDIVDIADATGDANDKRVRIDTRKWLMARLLPKQFGERVQVAGDAEAPLAVHIVALTPPKDAAE